ncbi:multi-sensor signal transduction histidine kinase [gamma proteobacterium BDW918]|uniref:histidine kinase n=1 Tax=Zhongshania aliphaticivorans TaxID=1470434 RepID=A0A127M8P3_9GAMM|nr:ATP-binding protein [Zhongshania aliphaticivorans]AMO69590.1 hypothetical protein AZF00_15370 [Zhongshania aliphaticivorans]EIF42247.1 multi-sensor signal transduction histidine kinase [gamma proteobacterium BDW918]
MKFGQRSIQEKIIALVITLVIVCSGVPLFFVYQALTVQLATNKALEFSGETELQGLLFTTRIQEMIHDVKIVASSTAAETVALSAEGSAERERAISLLATSFSQLLAEKPYYVQARYIGLDGYEKLRIDRYGSGGRLRRVPAEELQDKLRREYVRASFKDLSAPYYISRINLNRENGEITLPYEPVVRVAKLIFNGQAQLQGMLVINQRINDLFTEMAQMANPLYTYRVIDQEGNYLKHIDARKVFSFEFGKELSAFQDFPGIEDMFASEEPARYFSAVDGPSYQGALGVRTVSYDPRDPEHKIGIILLGSKADIDAMAADTLKNVLLIIVVLLVLAMFIGIAIARSLARPLRDIASAIRLDDIDASLEALPRYRDERVTGGDGARQIVRAAPSGRLLSVGSRRRDEVVALAWALRHYLIEIKDKTAALQTEIDDHNRAERALRTANHELSCANIELEQFSYIASHDLRAPLRVIDNAASWLEEDLAEQLNGEQLENLMLLRQRTRRLDKLLEDLADYTMVGKQQDSRYQTRVNGTQIIDKVRFLLKKPVDCELRFTGDWKNYEFVSMPLQHVLSNLINNAIKHGAKSGAKITVSARLEGDNYVFDITDNGPGIAPEYRELVFDMFKTLKPRDEVEGSGMGLAIVRKIVDLYGGAVSVGESTEGGCTFTVVWPKQALNTEA